MAKPPPIPTRGPNQQRVHPRYEVRIAAELRIGKTKVAGTVNDLAHGGIGLGLPVPLAEDQQVAVSLFLVVDGVEDERTPSLTLWAHVAWCAEADDGSHRCGLKLDELKGTSRVIFDALLEHVKVTQA